MCKKYILAIFVAAIAGAGVGGCSGYLFGGPGEGIHFHRLYSYQ
jgi:hypothetical protein